MIVSNDVANYTTAANTRLDAAAFDTESGGQQGGSQQQAQQAETPASTSSKVVTESDGSTMMQYTSMSPGGAIMRKNVMLHRADAFTPDPMNPAPMLRRRSDAYENMMQIF